MKAYAEEYPPTPDLYLIETLYCSRKAGPRYLERHLDRLAASARSLGFACKIELIEKEARRHAGSLSDEGPHRMRLALQHSGELECTSAPLPPLSPLPVGLLFGPDWGFAAQCSSNPLLRHKTSLRDTYDRGWKFAETQGGFDMLFTNERDEVTEGGRSNLFVKLNGRWWTPPIASGILPGIMRGMMLEDLDLGAQEKPLTLSEVMTAEELLLCSSLRGHLRTEMRRRPASERFDIDSHVPSLPR